jgi:hypothetical protein
LREACRALDAGSISLSRSSVVAGANAAHVIAVGVELANPAAAAIAVIIVTVVIITVVGGDGAADDRGADEAGSDAPARPKGLASAWVVVDATVPVTASAARASAAIFVLIDI